MTVHTVTPKHHLSMKAAALSLAGAGLAVGAAFGITTALSGEGATTAPGREAPRVVHTEGARDSWEGRIGPQARKQGSTVSPGLREEKLEQLR